MSWPDFRIDNFDSPDKPGSGKKMKKDFMDRLQLARDLARAFSTYHYGGDQPFVINSGFRTKRHNKKVGGAKNSPHLRGVAADISAPRSRDKYFIRKALEMAGFHRIGIMHDAIHVDSDPSLDPHVQWDYY